MLSPYRVEPYCHRACIHCKVWVRLRRNETTLQPDSVPICESCYAKMLARNELEDEPVEPEPEWTEPSFRYWVCEKCNRKLEDRDMQIVEENGQLLCKKCFEQWTVHNWKKAGF